MMKTTVLAGVLGMLACVFQGASQTPTMPPAPAGVPPKPADPMAGARPVLDLLSSLERFDQNGRDAAQKVGFELPESAVNQYIIYVLRIRPRPGVRAIRVSLLPRNQISAETEIDFGGIEAWNAWTAPENWKGVLTGRQTIRLNLGFDARNGTVSVQWKDAVGPDGKAIPAGVIGALMHAIAAHQPEAYDTNKPLPLPYGLKRIWVEKQVVGGET